MTKMRRLLSILLALLAGLTLCSTGASAIAAAPQPLCVTGVGWAYKEISWVIPGDAAAFMEGIKNGQTIVDWRVVNEDGEAIPLSAENGLVAVDDSANGRLALVVTPGTNKSYATYTVTFLLNGTPGQSITISLLDDNPLMDALDEAEYVASNPNNRYSNAYITAVGDAIRAAERALFDGTMTAEGAADALTALENILAAPEYKLSGIRFLDRLLDSHIEGVWNVVDFVTMPLRRVYAHSWNSVWRSILKTVTALLSN